MMGGREVHSYLRTHTHLHTHFQYVRATLQFTREHGAGLSEEVQDTLALARLGARHGAGAVRWTMGGMIGSP